MDEEARGKSTEKRSRRLFSRPEWRENGVSSATSIKPTYNASRNPPLMDITQSPLTQQSRPETFEPKVVTLYRQLFTDHGSDDFDLDDGFWQELFLLKPDLPQLRQILEETDAGLLLHIEDQPRQLLLNAIDAIKAREGPSDDHALETLTAFFAVILAKKYTSPSSDIIEVLAGLDHVDVVFTDLVATLEQTIRDGRDMSTKQKAVRATIAVVAGGYQTALISYFIHRDFFPALMKLVASHDDPLETSVPFLLIGLLANYDKFESATNSYRTQFGDFANDSAMSRISECIGWTSTLLRDMYVAIYDDTPAAWSIGGTLSYLGLGALAGAKPVVSLTEDEQKHGFNQLPGSQAAMLLPLYDFVLSNKFYAQNLIAQPSPDKAHPTPFAALLSFISYLLQHAHRSARAGWYAYLSTLILHILITDHQTCKSIMTTHAAVRLCRQRPPYLPVTGDRPYIAAILDIATDGINHNLRKKLDASLHVQLLHLLTRSLSQLSRSQTKLEYHWSELWRSLLSFVRFLAAYPEDVRSHYQYHSVIDGVVKVLSLALRHGESFVPNAKDYDDLVYKLVESGEALTQFRDAYGLKAPKDTGVELLIGASKHYRSLIEEKHGSKGLHLSPREVSRVIKQGYETLAIVGGTEDLVGDYAEGYREAEHKSSLKRLMRVLSADAQALLISEVPPGLNPYVSTT